LTANCPPIFSIWFENCLDQAVRAGELRWSGWHAVWPTAIGATGVPVVLIGEAGDWPPPRKFRFDQQRGSAVRNRDLDPARAHSVSEGR